MEWTDGMLYPVLHRLERLGHVEARWEVADERAPSQVLPASRRGAAPSSPRNAGNGRRSTRRCGASGARSALPDVAGQPTPTAAGSPDDAGSRPRGLARGADRPVAELPPPTAGDPLRRRGGAGGPPARAGRGADRRGARDRRGVPRRGQADGRPRRALARVRARALRAPLEAARRVGVRRRRASGDGGPQRRNRRVRTRRGRGGGGQGARALRPRPRRRLGLLRTQREPLRPAPADRLLRVEATAPPAHDRLAGGGIRRGRGLRERLSLRRRRLDRGAHGAAPADRRCGSSSASRTRGAAGARSPAGWTSSASRASSSSTSC